MKPKTVANAFWFGQPGAGGKAIVTAAIMYRSAVPKKPNQIARREAQKPYTSVKTSPKMYVTGNSSVAPLTANEPIKQTFCATRFDTNRMTTNAVVRASRYL